MCASRACVCHRKRVPLVRRGDLTSPVILWVGVLLAVFIVISWFMLRVQPITQQTNDAMTDLGSIKDAIAIACQSLTYEKQYNPVLNKGVVLVNETNVCLFAFNRTDCRGVPCAVEPSSYIIENATYLIVIRNSSGVYVRQRS